MCDRFNNVGLENYPEDYGTGPFYGADPEYTREMYGNDYYQKLYNDVCVLYDEKQKKIDVLVGELQKEYSSADQNYQASSLFTSIGFMHRMELCRELIGKINELYKTDYKLK